MQDFRELSVWQKAHEMTLSTYTFTKAFPQDERFGLTSQMRRASSSICANLAEGCCRRTDKDFARFVDYALGSASEVEYFLQLAKDLRYIGESDHEANAKRVCEIKRMLTGLRKRLMNDHSY